MKGLGEPLTALGLTFILLGGTLLLIALASKYVAKLSGLPPLLLYIYRGDGFIIATSPILIIIAAILLLLTLLGRT